MMQAGRVFSAVVLLGLVWASPAFSQGGGALEITSPAFGNNRRIPQKYTCDGSDISPPLTFPGIPEGTRSLALVCDDHDAPVGAWVHWVLFNIPPETTGLPEGVSSARTLPDGSVGGGNSWGKTGYGGPCPPKGTHRYVFRLYALDDMLDLPPDSSKQAVLAAMKGRILGEARLTGRYSKK